MIRRAGPGDVARMATVHAACFAAAWESAFLRRLLGDAGVAGWTDDARDGFILLRVAADEAEVLTLAVAPTLRRQGLARALLDAAIEDACTRGAARMFLEVAAGNAPARALYVGAGFAETGRRARYYADGDDALVLARTLA